MTVNEIFDAIKDYEDLDIWVDNGDQMWAADGTMETAQEMLDAIEEGARVEARIYYDEEGNRVPSDEYSSNVDVETVFDSDESITNEYDDKEGFAKVDESHFEKLKKKRTFIVYEAIKNKYGEKHCFIDKKSGELAYADDTRLISLYVFCDLDYNPLKAYYKHFDENGDHQDTNTYQVTSWDEVIEHFINEIEEK